MAKTLRQRMECFLLDWCEDKFMGCSISLLLVADWKSSLGATPVDVETISGQNQSSNKGELLVH
jgi:hypothetical protein